VQWKNPRADVPWQKDGGDGEYDMKDSDVLHRLHDADRKVSVMPCSVEERKKLTAFRVRWKNSRKI
jgi:hypothetical protein